MERMYGINEICGELHVARRTVHHWIATKQLRAFHLGGKRLTRVWEKDLLRFVRRSRPHGLSPRNFIEGKPSKKNKK